MSSHVHKAAFGNDQPLGSFLHALNGTFGFWLNRHEGGLGKVFAERPRSIVVSTEEGLARLIAYIHNNPVRAGVVLCPAQSTWTSHRAFIGEVSAPPFVAVEWALAAMGFSSSPSGRVSFHEYVVSRAGYPRDPSLSGPARSDIATAQRLLRATAAHFGIESGELARPTTKANRELRLDFIRVAKEVFALSNSHLAAVLGVSKPLLTRLVARAGLEPTTNLELLESYLRYTELSDSEGLQIGGGLNS